jgi:hypothetical protein
LGFAQQEEKMKLFRWCVFMDEYHAGGNKNELDFRRHPSGSVMVYGFEPFDNKKILDNLQQALLEDDNPENAKASVSLARILEKRGMTESCWLNSLQAVTELGMDISFFLDFPLPDWLADIVPDDDAVLY